MITLKNRRGLSCKTLLAVGVIASSTLAQSEDKFQMFGFSDMVISKYFPKAKSGINGVDKMDDRTYFSLDHVNLYTSFRPNKNLRFLTELSFQDDPVYYLDTVGQITSGTVTKKMTHATNNKIKRGITFYEWGTFSVERAVLTAYFNRYFNLTVGKFITPAGIWNVDHGSPVIMTISQPTQYSYSEIYPKSQVGLMEDGKIFIGDVDLSYTLYLSSGRDNQTLYKFNDLSVGGQLRVNFPVLDEFNIGFSGYTGRTDIKDRYRVVSINPATSVSETKFQDIDKIVYRENVFGADARLRKWRTALQAEINYQHITDHLKEGKPTSGALAFYVIGSVDALKKEALAVTPYSYYEYVKYINPKNNPANAGRSSIAYHKYMGGINFRAFTNYGIKIEYNFTRLIMPTPDPDGLFAIPGIGSQFYIAF